MNEVHSARSARIVRLDHDGNPVGEGVEVGVVGVTLDREIDERRVVATQGRYSLSGLNLSFETKLDAAARKVFEDIWLVLNPALGTIRGTAAAGHRIGQYLTIDDAYAHASDRERRFTAQALRARGLDLVDAWPGVCRVVRGDR